MSQPLFLILSHQLNHQTPTYGNRDKFTINPTSQIKKGNSANSSSWYFSSNHIGSHADMPRHFFNDGKSLTDYSANDWIFNRVQLIDVPLNQGVLIGPEHISGQIATNTDLLLIRTGFEQYRGQDKYWNDNPGLKPELSVWIKENRPSIRALGFDFISLSSWQHRGVGKKAHQEFLKETNGQPAIWIFEDISLKCVKKDIIRILVAPMLVEGADGSPVTIFAEVTENN
jgi:arylformamidase